MIKAMLANIPCMSKETLAENRRKIEQHSATPNNQRDNEESKQSKKEQEHSQLLL